MDYLVIGEDILMLNENPKILTFFFFGLFLHVKALPSTKQCTLG